MPTAMCEKNEIRFIVRTVITNKCSQEYNSFSVNIKKDKLIP